MDQRIKMKKVLFISRSLYPEQNNGGQVVARRNLMLLKKIFGEDCVDTVHYFPPKIHHRLGNFLFRSSYGDCSAMNRTLAKYDFEKCRFAFFDGSLEGQTVKKLSDKNVKTIVFYHNIEQNYYADYLKNNPGLSSTVMRNYVVQQESINTRHADFRIVLNQRDGNALNNLYQKTADCILPTSFDDPGHPSPAAPGSSPYALFVGSGFFANIQGISWYIENVLNQTDLDLVVVGSVSKSLESYIASGKYPRLKVMGMVDDLSPFYQNASCVVSPIFLGSGLKTKTIEALMFGKTFLGTDEAFQGVSCDYDTIGGKCNTADEFIAGIRKICETPAEQRINWNSYKLFCETFSTECAVKNLSVFLQQNALGPAQKTN